MLPRVPTCLYCERPYSSPQGCEYEPGDEKPMAYGSECHPFSIGPTCRDCGSPKGTEHHAYCLATECPDGCHGQFHPGMTCEENRQLVNPSGRAA